MLTDLKENSTILYTIKMEIIKVVSKLHENIIAHVIL